MGEKDYQQLFLVKNFIKGKYKSKIYSCPTIRDKNKVALSSRNYLLSKEDLNKAGLIVKILQKTKSTIKINNSINAYLNTIKNNLIKKFNIKIEYLEIRNEKDLKQTFINKKYRLFFAYYVNKVRLIDNF